MKTTQYFTIAMRKSAQNPEKPAEAFIQIEENTPDEDGILAQKRAFVPVILEKAQHVLELFKSGQRQAVLSSTPNQQGVYSATVFKSTAVEAKKDEVLLPDAAKS